LAAVLRLVGSGGRARIDRRPVGDWVELGAAEPCVVPRSGSAMVAYPALRGHAGNNDHGQIGDGTMVSARTTPVSVSGLTDAVEVSAGQAHTCARRGSESVVCLGGNRGGQIGDGTSGADRLTPVGIAGL